MKEKSIDPSIKVYPDPKKPFSALEIYALMRTQETYLPMLAKVMRRPLWELQAKLDEAQDLMAEVIVDRSIDRSKRKSRTQNLGKEIQKMKEALADGFCERQAFLWIIAFHLIDVDAARAILKDMMEHSAGEQTRANTTAC